MVIYVNMSTSGVIEWSICLTEKTIRRTVPKLEIGKVYVETCLFDLKIHAYC